MKQWKTFKIRNEHSMTWNMAKNTEKRGKWETHTVRPGLSCETLKKVQNEKCTLFDLEYGKNTEKHGTWEMHTVGSGIWKKMKKLENVKCTLYDLKFSERHWKTLKMRIAHSRTWSWGETWKICKMKHKHCMTWNIQEILKNVENEKFSLWDL